ncbi:MAG: hypothetical protein IKP97_03145 [Kiritimatiellae bacterium]|nr:hypothetical protein [Kiritimatiellia bacterium]
MDNEMLNLGSLDFTPDWARKDAGVKVSAPRNGGADARERGPARERDDRPPRKFDRKPHPNAPRPPHPVEKPLDAEIKILPETRALGTIIRKIQNDPHAYKLKDLAYFFLDNPESVMLKITPKPEAPVKFFQCKACGFAATNEQDVIDHLVAEHLGDYYVAETVECEPPKGNFAVVARCGLSGVLLGPPNIHEFNSTLKEMIRTKYPQMSEEEYRSHLEMVRDAETIEAWRKSATAKTVYFAKSDAEKARPLTREQAEGEFKRVMLANMVDSPKSLMIGADKALKSPVKPLVWAVKDALREESKAPYAMCFALRGAFHHRKLKFFRANDARGPEFVTSLELKEFDSAHAIPELAAVADFIKEHPCSPKVDIVKDAEGERHLNWLVSTGHLVAYTNGVYSAVEKFPKYGPQYQKRGKKDEAAAELAE